MIEALWVVTGHRPVLWTFPIRIQFGDKAYIRPAIPFREKERRAFKDVMRDINARMPEPDLWTVSYLSLKRVAAPATTEFAEECATWARPHRIEDPKFARPPQRSEFTDALFLKGVGQTREEVAAWWSAFCNHALDWLINKEKPVDLTFATLWPTVRREDWRARMNARREIKPDTRRAFFHEEKFQRRLMAGRLLSLNPDGTIDRAIEVELGRLWYRIVRRVEKERKKVLKKDYAAMVVQTMARQLAWATASYCRWHSTIHKTSATVVPGRVAGTVEFAPNRGGAFVANERNRALLALGPAAYAKAMARRRAELQAEKARVQRVRDLQQSGWDVRDGGGNVARPGDGAAGEAGMLVPGAGQSVAGNGGVLAGGSKRAEQMAARKQAAEIKKAERQKLKELKLEQKALNKELSNYFK